MSIWHEYAEVMLNPGHALAEGTFALGEFILASIIWARVIKPSWKKMLDRLHTDMDEQHGINHEDNADALPLADLIDIEDTHRFDKVTQRWVKRPKG